jgi:hypothetical protein
MKRFPDLVLLAGVMMLADGCATRVAESVPIYQAPGQVQTAPAALPPETNLIAPIPPPPPLAESVPGAPSGEYVWVPGHWGWNGAWFWISGRWTPKPYVTARWAPGRWEQRGRRFVWMDGRWW